MSIIGFLMKTIEQHFKIIAFPIKTHRFPYEHLQTSIEYGSFSSTKSQGLISKLHSLGAGRLQKMSCIAPIHRQKTQLSLISTRRVCFLAHSSHNSQQTRLPPLIGLQLMSVCSFNSSQKSSKLQGMQQKSVEFLDKFIDVCRNH